jgi:sialic acid synthase SpsE
MLMEKFTVENSFGQIENIASKYQTDNIFILGKGLSADEIDRSIFDNGLTITINDAEKIARGDIGVFHAPWVVDSLKRSGFGCAVYVTNQPLPAGVARLAAEYVPPDQFSSDLLVQRFHDEELLVEDVMLITAIKIARIVAAQRMRRQKVYLIGFDFSGANSQRLDKDYTGETQSYQTNVISAQEHYLLVFLNILRDSNIHLVHVGSKAYSTIDSHTLNRRLGNTAAGRTGAEVAASGSHSVMPAHPAASEHVLITAEITTNHFGDIAKLEQMIRRAKDAGADLVKLQKRDVESFYTGTQLAGPFDSPFGKTFRDYRQALELDASGFRFISELTKEIGIDWFVSVLDWPSYEFMLQFEPSIIKLPSTISKHVDFLKFVAQTYKGDVVISTGLTDQAYEDFILDTFSENSKLFLLQCTSAYPTPPGDCNVAVVRHYRDLSFKHRNLVPGYSSHDFGSTACMLAVAAGAKMVEKHVKLGNAEWAHFDGVALDLATDAFHGFVADIRLAERLLGREHKSISDSEHHKYWVRSN